MYLPRFLNSALPNLDCLTTSSAPGAPPLTKSFVPPSPSNSTMSQLVGSVFERTPSRSTQPSKLSGSSQTGFPIVQHRSKKSAFARGRDELKRNSTGKDVIVPVVQPTPKLPQPRIDTREVTSADDLRRQISEENDRRIEGMSEEERERERREIIEQFGTGVEDLLRRAKEAREKREREQASSTFIDFAITSFFA